MPSNRPVTIKLTMKQGEQLRGLVEDAWSAFTGNSNSEEYDDLRTLNHEVGASVERAKARGRRLLP